MLLQRGTCMGSKQPYNRRPALVFTINVHPFATLVIVCMYVCMYARARALGTGWLAVCMYVCTYFQLKLQLGFYDVKFKLY